MPLWTKVLSPMTLTTRLALGVRQDVAQSQAHGDARAHANAGVHRRKRRQNAQRVAADVARDDAIQVAQALEHDAVRAAFAELRRFAGHFGWLRGGVVGQDAADARDVQFAKAVHLGLALDVDARRADGVHQIRIAFFNHHAALDALGETPQSPSAAADKSGPA
jgi:hypothetical protein